MALIKPNPPAACAAAFSAQLPTFLWGPGGLTNTRSVGNQPPLPTAVDIAAGPKEALQVFVASASDAANNTGTISPVPAGWQFMAGTPANSKVPRLVLGRMVQRPPSLDWKLIALYYGPIVGEDADAIQTLNNLPQVQTENYEVRVLEVPGLNFKAFWLKAMTAGSPDLAIPNPAGPGQLISALSGSGFYNMADVVTALRQPAITSLNTPATHGA
jgi:hypothetical protein